jgi:hypothetical protein
VGVVLPNAAGDGLLPKLPKTPAAGAGAPKAPGAGAELDPNSPPGAGEGDPKPENPPVVAPGCVVPPVPLFP